MKTTAFAATMALTLPLLATTSTTALAVSTDEFVNKVTVSDMFEVQSGKLASEKAKNEDVKDFGEQMVEDHSDNTDELMELIDDKDIDVQPPTELDKKHQANLDKLKNVSGAKFDQTYIPMQVLAHEDAVNVFEDYSKSGDNEALKEWAGDTLPTLKEHLKEARELNTELSEPDKTAAADDKTMTDKADDEAKTSGQMTAADKSADKEAMDKKAVDKKATNDKTMTEVTEETDVKDTAKNKDVSKPDFKFVTRQAQTDWSAHALIGREVYNTKGETLGDINNVILNEKGNVVAVTIGVGGFLGLGEKDVGVPFDALKFATEKAIENDDMAMTDDDEAKQADKTAAAESEKKSDDADQMGRFDAEHSEMEIVLDATKEQLESAPDFVWLDEQDEKRAERETETSVE